MRVKEVMSRHVITVDYNRSCSLAAKIMAQNETGSVLVRKGEDMVGIITETDIIRRVVARGGDLVTVMVDAIMSFPICVINEEASVQEARKMMSENQIRHLAVTRQGKIVGILSARNLLEISLP